MRKVLVLALLHAVNCLAQTSSPIIISATDPSGACPAKKFDFSISSGKMFFCNATNNTWSAPSAGVSGTGTVTSIIFNAPLTGGTVVTTGNVGIPKATSSVNGYLASADFTTFAAAVPSARTITATAPLTINSTTSADLSANRTIAMSRATSSVDGYLAASDFAVFLAGGAGACPTCLLSSAPTTNALLKGAGTQTLTTTGITIDSSNNTSSPGGATFGVGGSTSGFDTYTATTSGHFAKVSVSDTLPSDVTFLIQPTTATRALTYTFFNSGGLTSGVNGYITAPFGCTISAWSMQVDAGTATVDIWKIATGTAHPTITNTITASALPAISTGTAKRSTTLTGWTTAIAATDFLAFNLQAVSTATNVNITLECTQ